MASVHYAILGAVQTRIQALALSGIASGQVYKRKLPTDRGVTLPCVLVTLGGDAETIEPGSYETTEVGYPVLVTTVAAGNQAFTLSDDELQWRQSIIDEFLDKPLAGVTEADVYDCRVEPRSVIDVGLWHEQNLSVSAVLLRFLASKTRV